MNIVLANPKRSPFTGEQITAPHLGLLAMAAAVREGTFADTKGARIDVFDDQLLHLLDEAYAPAGFLDQLAEPPDIVGVQAVTCNLSSAADLLKRVKARYPNALTVMGGAVMASSDMDTEVVARGLADIAVRGEGEVPFSALVYCYGTKGRAGLNKVPGIAYLDEDGKVAKNPAPSSIRNLDSLPLPARDLANFPIYHRVSRGRCGNILITRGCSYACTYCYSKHHWGRGQRRSSIQRVVEEVRILVEDHGLDRVRFEDDDFTENAAWVKEICRHFEETNLSRSMEWEVKGRPEHMNPELLAVMRRAGCFRIMMGVESLEPERLKSLDRPVQVTMIEDGLKALRNAGIGCQATMILGIPGESDAAMRGTLEWLQARLKGAHDIVSPCFYVPFFEQIDAAMKEANPYKIVVQDRDYYSGHLPITSSDACSFEELVALYDHMTPDRRGMYPLIAHLAGSNVVRERLRGIRKDSQDAPSC